MSGLATALKLFLFIFCFKQFQCRRSEDPALICPPENLIKPCTCEKPWYANEVHLICERIYRQEVLLEVLEKSSDYAYTRFELRSSCLMYLPISAFHIKKLNRISIFSSTMVSLFNQPPPDDNVLDRLDLEKVRISRKLDWSQFRTLTKLKEVRVREVNLKKIGKDFKDNLPDSVEVLAFFDNNLTRVDDSVMERLTQLKDVTFQGGKLKELKRSMFPVPARITDLDFSSNDIQSLPTDLFSQMPDLKSIAFNNNLITMIPEDVYGHVLSQLDYLYVYGNPLICRCYLRWILTAERGHVYLSGRCAEPEELESRDLRSLVPKDFAHCQ